jgi:hypothetical protein
MRVVMVCMKLVASAELWLACQDFNYRYTFHHMPRGLLRISLRLAPTSLMTDRGILGFLRARQSG